MKFILITLYIYIFYTWSFVLDNYGGGGNYGGSSSGTDWWGN